MSESNNDNQNVDTYKSNSPQTTTPNTYTIDIRYFLIRILSSICVFFAIGVWSSPNANHHAISSISPNQQHIPTQTKEDTIVIDMENNKNNNFDDLKEHHVHFQQPSYEDLGTGTGIIQRSTKASMINNTKTSLSSASRFSLKNHQHYSSKHLPSGQHLLVDIQYVQTSFLNSEERLVQAMVDLVNSVELIMLSYHCHSLIPLGVSCVGVLLEGHISFHTWPEEGVITLDLFTCGERSLLFIVPEVERLFGVPRIEGGKVESAWSHELRGFRDVNNGDKIDNDDETLRSPNKVNFLDNKSDLSTWVITPIDLYYKEQVVTMTSQFNRIDVWDVKYKYHKLLHEDGLKHNLTRGDPRWMTQEFATPHRILFVNGALLVCELTYLLLFVITLYYLFVQSFYYSF